MNSIAIELSGAAPAALVKDRFDNRIDPTVSCPCEEILRNNAGEILRQRQAYNIGRERCAALEPDCAYNLTGLIRGSRFKPEDLLGRYS